MNDVGVSGAAGEGTSAAAAPGAGPSRPLVVDLDGTLVASDTLWEALFGLLSTRPWMALLVPLWLLRGRAFLKARMAAAARIDVSLLPYRPDVVSWLKAEAAAGRRLVLATAADARIAEAVAGHLGIFGLVLASDGRRNLKGRAKLDAIREALGPAPFDYVGDSRADRPVWSAAGRAIVVERGGLLSPPVAPDVPVLKAFAVAPARLSDWRKAIRLHQWAKNVLLFVPLILSHEVGDVGRLLATVFGFVAFGLCASATYIWNDMLDLASDRRHPTKRARPLASGRLPLGSGFLASIALALAGYAIALGLISPGFALVLAGYMATTLAYSVYLKRKLMIDVIVLGGFFALRVFAGAVASDVAISPWLLAFSIFFFLSLAFVKRYSDLANMPPDDLEKLGGRGYFASDLDLVRVLGPLSGYVAVMVMTLYVNSPAVTGLYARPQWLWMVCLCVLYWISRVWFLAHRGHMPDDPVIFALRDGVSRLVGLATLGFVVLAAISWP